MPSPGRGSSLAAPAYVGLCGTDLELVAGSMPYFRQGYAHYPLQPGHEWSGTLLEPNDRWPAGARFILDPVVACGRVDCEPCSKGLVVRCAERAEFGVRGGLDGALATAVTAPDGNMLPIPDGVSLRDAALVEPAVTSLEGIRRIAPQPGEEALIVGAGTLGLVAAMVLAARGIHAHVLMRRQVRAATVEAAGATPWTADTLSAKKTFDVVIEAAGTASGIRDALAHVAPGGRLALLGVPSSDVDVDVSAIVLGDVTIKGVLNGPGQYAAGLAAIASGEIRPELLIDRIYPFDEIEAAVIRSKDPERERPKVLVQIDPDAR